MGFSQVFLSMLLNISTKTYPLCTLLISYREPASSLSFDSLFYWAMMGTVVWQKRKEQGRTCILFLCLFMYLSKLLWNVSAQRYSPPSVAERDAYSKLTTNNNGDMTHNSYLNLLFKNSASSSTLNEQHAKQNISQK